MPRPRKPSATKRLQGTFRRDRAVENEPVLDEVVGVLSAPDHLNAYAQDEWRRLYPILKQMRVLTAADMGALELLCDTYGMWRELRDAVYASGSLSAYLAGKNSQTTPEITVMMKLQERYKTLLTEFGLTPASRTKVAAETKRDERRDDPTREFLQVVR